MRRVIIEKYNTYPQQFAELELCRDNPSTFLRMVMVEEYSLIVCHVEWRHYGF